MATKKRKAKTVNVAMKFRSLDDLRTTINRLESAYNRVQNCEPEQQAIERVVHELYKFDGQENVERWL
jgi:hypothetical protein